MSVYYSDKNTQYIVIQLLAGSQPNVTNKVVLFTAATRKLYVCFIRDFSSSQLFILIGVDIICSIDSLLKFKNGSKARCVPCILLQIVFLLLDRKNIIHS